MKYCCEDISRIENYELAKKDDFKGWACHHRLETHTSEGERRLVGISMGELKALGMYYRRPASELIFLTKSEHQKLHHTGRPGPNRGKHFSEEWRRKMSESLKGKKLVKGLFCIDTYDKDGNLKVEKYIVGVSLRDLWNGLNKAVGDSTKLDCSSATAFRNKFRKGRDVKLTNKDTKEVLLARIRQLEKRVEFLEKNKDTKEVLYARIRELKSL